MRRVNKAVIGILAGIQRPHAVELAKKNRGQQMVHSKGVVGMPLQNLIELLHGAIVIKIVEMKEFDQVLQRHPDEDRKSTRLNSSHLVISYAVFCLKKKKKKTTS